MNPRKPRSLMLLMPLPSRGMLHHEVHAFLTHLRFKFVELGVPYHEQIIPGMDQPQCRAELLAFYYRHRESFEDLLWLDSDTIVAPDTVLELARLEEPIVGVPYEQRRRDEARYPEGSIENWAVATDGLDAQVTVREGRRMLPVRGFGLGCARIRRDAVERMWNRARTRSLEYAAPFWRSEVPGMEGTEVCGLFEPIVHMHPEGKPQLACMRRRPEDMSFFVRAREAGLQPYVLCDAAIWHDGKGGVSLWDALVNQERDKARMRRRVDFELADCPDNLLGLHEVLDGAYDIVGLELDPGEVILDLGANIGAFAVWASKRFPGARIHCYEPVPENFERLTVNVAGIPSVAVMDRAAVIGDDTAITVRIAPGRCNDGEWSCRDDKGIAHDAGRAIEVSAVAASKLPRCAVLKIDTEGCEREILEGYRYLSGCKALMLEWHSLEDYRWIMAFAGKHGFLPMVDRARGRALPDRELCFVRRDVFLGHDEEHQGNGVSAPAMQVQP